MRDRCPPCLCFPHCFSPAPPDGRKPGYVSEVSVFGWFTSTSSPICHSCRAVPAQRRWLRMSPERLVCQLPLLGCVLYVPARPTALATESCISGVLLAHRELAPLLLTQSLGAASAITEDGPREWLECLDDQGQLHARLHLLPDTDYLAWDALLQMADMEAPTMQLHGYRNFQPGEARLVSFRHRELAGLSVLEAAQPQAISNLGRQIAKRITQAEAIVLQGVA